MPRNILGCKEATLNKRCGSLAPACDTYALQRWQTNPGGKTTSQDEFENPPEENEILIEEFEDT